MGLARAPARLVVLRLVVLLARLVRLDHCHLRTVQSVLAPDAPVPQASRTAFVTCKRV